MLDSFALYVVLASETNGRTFAFSSVNSVKKLEDDAANPTYILTDSHVGYRFREP